MTENRMMSIVKRVVAATGSMACLFGGAGVPAQSTTQADKGARQEPGVVQKVGGAVGRGVKAAASGVERGVEAAASGARRAGHAVGRGAEAMGHAANKGAKKIGVPTEGASAPKR